MAVKINFSASHHVIPPTLVLATRSGHKISYLPAANISIKDTFNERFEMVFQIYKEDCDKCDPTLWDKITDFKLCWCKDWDLWFEMYIEVQTEYSTVKNVICYSIGEAELTKTSLYNIEINTEDDINRPDYDEKFPTILYRPDMPEASMLHRIMEKVPHYTIRHVDAHLAKEQRTFSFDDISIYDAFQKISDDLDCVFIIDSCSNPDGSISRSISVYDLEAYCDTCGHRGNFIGNCPECGSIHVRPGYGEDTTIYVSTENLADSITLKTDVDAVSNCFRLETGDGLMTAAVIDSNPNGSQYIWRISEEAKKDMSEELVARLTEYEKTYEYYQDRHITILRSSVRNPYNALVEKYQPYKKDKDGNDELHPLPVNITGYSELMNAYYDAIDFSLFLRSSFMPNPKFGDTTAEIQASRLNSVSLEGTAVQNLATCSTATASNAVAACARTSVDPRYQVKVKRGVLEGKVWTGVLTITNYSDEVDTADTVEIRITLNDDYETFCRQKMRQILKGSDEGVLANSIIPLFSMGMELFTDSIKLFCLDSLVTFHDACQSCLDILVEQGIADNKTWADKDPNLYESLYKPYYNKLMALEKEIRLRESELAIVEGVYSPDGEVKQEGLQSFVVRVKNSIQRILDFPRFFGEDLWLEFIAYRRETTFKGDSYVSDGLDNAKLFKNAQTFLDVVQGRIIEASTPHPSISATLRNLLVMPEFAPIVDKFSVGNWIRIRVDGILYRLRLRSYTIDFTDLDNIQIEFSNAMKATDSTSNIRRTLLKARAMSSTYSTVVKQAEKGEESKNLLNSWVENGLDATNTKIIGGADNQTQTWDSHGMLFRKYDAVTDSYTDEQMKIINSTLAITDDNWETSKTAVGKIIYYDPENGVAKEGYGVNGEVLVGKLILGQTLGIYNAANTMKFTEDGLDIRNSENTNWLKVNPNDVDNFFELSLNSSSSNMGFNKDGIHVSNERHEFTVNPNDECLMNIKSGDTDVLKFNEDGDLEITGCINATSGNVSMFNINDGDEGLTAYFEDTRGVKQYGLGKNRFFVYLRNALNKFIGHIDLNNGSDNGSAPYLSIGSDGDVSILSNSKIQFGTQEYVNNGIGQHTAMATITGSTGRIETKDAVKYNGAIQTTSYANTCAFDSTGIIKQYVSSSKRYKHDITEGFDETTNYKKLLELPVVTYRYNEGYCDDDNGKLHIGFIAEDIDKLFPTGCNYKDGQPENWNVMEMVPAILKLVQEQHKTIHKLKSEIGRLKKDLRSMQ
jgi:hypothetical protein